MMDWDAIRKNAFAPDEVPEHWTKGVRGISIDGVSLLGVHEKTGALYWDGKEIKVEKPFTLGTFERVIVLAAAAGTFGTFVLEVYKLWFK